jgi:putative ABC transport system ATP-binding protein
VPTPKFEQPVAPEAAPMKPTDKPTTGGAAPAGAGDGNAVGGGGQRGNRTGGMGGRKKFADMSPEELQQAKDRLDGMPAMIDRFRDRIEEAKVKELEGAISALRKALDANDLAGAQTHQDKISAAMRGMMGGGRGGAGGLTVATEDPRVTAASDRPIIAEFVDVHRHYVMGKDNVVRALNGVSVQVRKGDYLAIMGRSGSGKSTMLNILGGLDRPTTGEYRVGGRDVSKLDDDALSDVRGREIGFIFQSFNLIPQLTVLENLEVPLFYQGRVGPESRAKAQYLADRVGLGKRLEHKPMELSGGQQQRVAIARALMNDPLFLLADEATGNLDSNTEREILDLFDDLRKDGVTIVIVTHNPKVAERADFTLWLKDGQVEKLVDNRAAAPAAGGAP